MNHTAQIIATSFSQAIQELRVNKLRTFLSLLGIAIGIFCIIGVLTVLDSMKDNIKKQMSSMGSDVLYIGRWSWTGEGNDKWWEMIRRPNMTPVEVKAVESQSHDLQYTTLSMGIKNMVVKHGDQQVTGISGMAVLNHFDKIQNIEIEKGRYFSASEIDGGGNSVVLGNNVYEALFAGNVDPIGSTISFMGRTFSVVGVMKKAGTNMIGMDYDNSIILSYFMAAKIVDVKLPSFDPSIDPTLVIKAATGRNLEDVKYEVEGILRRVRRVKPGAPDNFSINQLSKLSQSLDAIFVVIDVIGLIIGLFSLIVGAFGIANIMFVTVKERTKIIGLKKAIGATSRSILTEFLFEAVALSIIGGLFGIIIVLLLSLLLTYGADFAVTLSAKNFTIGITVSAVVGILAGFIPARSASRLDPVVAIRSN